jgi:integrase
MRRTKEVLDEKRVTGTINAVAATGLEIVKVEVDREGRIALTTAWRVDKNRVPSEEEDHANTFEAIGREYLRHEAKRGLSSAHQYRWTLERWIFPEIGAVQVRTLKRSDIIGLVDNVGSQSGPAMARQVFSVLRRVLNWYAARDDDFNSPIKWGMAREVVARAKARDRVLDDDELCAVWRATEGNSWPFGSLVRFLFLTAARRSEAQGMRWAEVNGRTGDWVLPVSRSKIRRALVRPLSTSALGLLNGLPRIGEYVFTMTGSSPIGSISKSKRLLDDASGVSDWTLHDLRRTARSLMSRAGVPERHAEECLGHVQGGVRATYDRYSYHDEKKQAYEALAAKIKRIVNGFGA